MCKQHCLGHSIHFHQCYLVVQILLLLSHQAPLLFFVRIIECNSESGPKWKCAYLVMVTIVSFITHPLWVRSLVYASSLNPHHNLAKWVWGWGYRGEEGQLLDQSYTKGRVIMTEQDGITTCLTPKFEHFRFAWAGKRLLVWPCLRQPSSLFHPALLSAEPSRGPFSTLSFLWVVLTPGCMLEASGKLLKQF